MTSNREKHTGKLITAGSVKEIDWNAMHSEQREKTSLIGEGVDRWNRYAASPTIGEIDPSYIEELMPRLALPPEMSVMDVGCGNGGIAIALASRVREVVALDYAAAALESLQSKIRESGCNNIKTVLADFNEVEIGKDVEVCDVVLASRSLPMGNLKESLEKVNQAARRLCYLVNAASDNELTKWICAEMGMDYRPFPEYIITLNLLYTMGIKANMEIFSVTGTYNFADFEEAVSSAVLGNAIKDGAARKKIAELVNSQVVYEDGFYKYTYHKDFALIWWRKEAELIQA